MQSTNLNRLISTERLQGYSPRANSFADFEPMQLYLWNIKLSESLYPMLEIVEVALRNSIHYGMSEYLQDEDWLYNTDILHTQELIEVERVKWYLGRQHKALTIGRVIAELGFGFWTRLFDSRYDGVWSNIISLVFPNMLTKNRTRQYSAKRINSIRRLRNRVFHHEPIWYRHDLEQQYKELKETIGWMDASALMVIKKIDRFPNIFKCGPRMISAS